MSRQWIISAFWAIHTNLIYNPHPLPPNFMPTLGFSFFPYPNKSPGAISRINERGRERDREGSVSRNDLSCPTEVLAILRRWNTGIRWRIAAIGAALCCKLCVYRDQSMPVCALSTEQSAMKAILKFGFLYHAFVKWCVVGTSIVSG